MIRLRTLGTLDLRVGEGEQLRAILGQPKRVALLAYLALANPGGPHQRETLLALFWPEHDEEHARNSLSQSVHVLRRSLGPDVLVSENGGALRLARDGFWCDAVAFDRAVADGRLAEAVELYRGELLDGFHVANAPEFERWLAGERERLARRCMEALERLALEREAAGDFGGAVAWWRRVAARDPYSSRATLRLMRALEAAGDPAAAVQLARVHETLLREELGVAVDPAIVTLVRQLESGKHARVPQHSPGGDARREPHLGTTSDAASASPLGTTEPTGTPVRDVAAASAPAAGARRRAWPRLRHAALATAGLVTLAAAVVVVTGETRAPIRSVAVLPLVNLSRDSAYQAFTEGMHDALITELARYPDLRVTSRTSVLRYRGIDKPLPEIAKELKVDGVIMGTLLWEGGHVRMNAQLVHGPTDRHLWARSYERDLRDVLVLQGELAHAIAREVRVASSPVLRARRSVAGPADSVPGELHLRELYLRGWHAELGRSLAGLQAAREAYRRAIELDSTFALGHAGLSSAYRLMGDYAWVPLRQALDTARLHAVRAVALDSTLPETRTALALSYGDAGEYEAAEREFRRAIELGPSNARAHYWYALLLVALGRGEEALREIDRADELDPFAPRGVAVVRRYALFLVTGERGESKVPVALRRHPVLRLEPGEAWAIAHDAIDFAGQGHCVEARSEIERAQRLVAGDNVRMLSLVAGAYWSCGDRARARAVLERAKRRPEAREQGAWVAPVHALFGERDSAFAWLDGAVWTTGTRADLRARRWLDTLHSDPRYAQLLDRLGLQPAVRTDIARRPAPGAARSR